MTKKNRIFVCGDTHGMPRDTKKLNGRKILCKVGRPSGLLYFPPESKNIQSMISLQMNILFWIFKTPQWIKEDKSSLSYLKKIRLSLAIGNILIILFAIAMVVSLRQ